MKTFFHYCSKGFKSEILYNSEVEFVAGMNRIAVCVALCRERNRPVVVIAICLMDNHFHFILWGEESDCDYFVDNYRKLTAMWIVRHRGMPLAEQMEIGHWHIAPDKLGQKIVYVLRNPIAAGMRVVPQGYRWSSASLMFSEVSLPSYFKRVADVSSREVCRICNTKVTLPDEWLVSEEMVWPGSYIDIPSAEKAFRSVGAFMYDLNNGNIDKETEEEMLSDYFSLADSEVRLKAVQLGIDYFHKDRLTACSADERLKIARLLKKDLKCNVSQLARVLHLKPETLKLMV